MPLRNAKPEPWLPKGLSDAVDGTDAFPGAMASLSNLVPDPSTASIFVPRPAAQQLQSFQTVKGAGQVTAMFIQGDIVYGMISSGLVAGCDQPFAYNLDTGSLITVKGITPSNVPFSPLASGDWTPPTMDSLGSIITVTHPGFNTYNGYIGWFDVTNPLQPVWHSGNLGTNPLPLVPVACRQFGSRMYYAVANGVVASDIQNALNVSNSGGNPQILTFGDRTSVTALGGLPLYNTQGGIIQSLIVFKSSNIMYQVTGDYSSTTTPWSINSLNVATGTLAPNTICTTPQGLAFVAPDGVRLVTFTGTVTDPIGANGQGVTLPFKNPIAPSRMCAAFNQNVLRISVQNSLSPTQGFQEYWYDFNLKIWSGPHTFPVALIQPWKNTFIAVNPIVAGQ